MFHIYDPDEWESTFDSRPCTVCAGDMRKCNGMCNGSSSYVTRKRSPEEVAKIKAGKRLKREDEILAEADAIRARRTYGL